MTLFRFCFGLSCTATVVTAIFAGAAAGIIAGMATMAVTCVVGFVWLMVRPALKP